MEQRAEAEEGKDEGMTLQEHLRKLNACRKAREWAAIGGETSSKRSA